MKVRDPVCGMCIEWVEAVAFQTVGDAVVYFCCPGCAARFREAPEDYLDNRSVSPEVTSCPPRPRPEPVSSHGVPAAVPRTLLPSVGSLHIDEFEERVHRAWAGEEIRGGACRVLSRALLCRVLGWAEPHGISVRIAAEISVLRNRCDDLAAILDRLAALPEAVATACREAGLSRDETNRMTDAITGEVADARLWLASYHSTLERPMSGRGR